MGPVSAAPPRRERRAGEVLWQEGGSRVLEGVDPETGAPVLVRVPRTAGRRDDLAAIRRDFEVSRALTASSVLRPHALRRDESGLALLLVDEGHRPLEWLLETAPHGPDRFVTTAAGLAAAVAELHAEGCTHANLTPHSILLHPEAGSVRLTDFCHAAQYGGEARAVPRGGLRRGDLAYLAPEQTGRMGKQVDHRADLYSVGVVLYRLLTGRLPFDATDPLELAHCHLAVRPPDPARHVPHAPPLLCALVLKLLAKSPDERYQTAQGLAADLATCADHMRATGRIEPFELGSRDAVAELRAPASLYGRDREVERLLEAFEAAVAGGTAAVLVDGPPGIGKSALVAALEKPVTGRRAFYARGKFEQLRGGSAPYAPVVDALRGLVHEILLEPEEALEGWRSLIDRRLGREVGAVIDVVPELGSVTGLREPAPPLPEAEARNRMVRLLARLIAVFARAEHPLVLFLDDLQWADSASLAFIEALLTTQAPGHLLLVGAYRDTEVGGAHPLLGVLERVGDAGRRIARVHLPELGLEPVTAIVADMLRAEPQRVEALARLVHRKSDGNPFFAGQFLHFLVREGLLRHEPLEGAWSWDLEAIDRHGVPDDVVALVARRLQSLPEPTRGLLAFASCLGGTFGLGQLAIAADAPRAEVLRGLRPALDAGVAVSPDRLVFLGEDPEADASFRFVHDRVQQAAYQSTRAEDRSRMHLAVGRRLRTRSTDEELALDPFGVVENLNRALPLLDDPEERAGLARLNLSAARRSRAAQAYQTALACLRSGLNALPAGSWDTRYDLSYELHEELLESARLAGDFGAAADAFDVLIARARTDRARARAHRTRIAVLTAQGRHTEAIRTCTDALALLGVRLPAEPGPLRVLWSLVRMRLRLGLRAPMSLAELPGVEDDDRRLALELLDAVATAAYHADPRFLAVSTLAIVDLSVRYGVGPGSAKGFAVYSMLLGSGVGRYARGDQFGRLALELADRHGDLAVRGQILLLYASMVSIWTRPLDTSIDLIREAHALSIEAGDHDAANLPLLALNGYAFDSGVALPRVMHMFEQSAPFALETGHRFAIHNHRLWRQAILALWGRTVSPTSLSSGEYDQDAALAEMAAEHNRTSHTEHFILRLQLGCVFRDFEEAWRMGQRADADADAVFAQMIYAQHHFYLGLAAAGVLRGRSDAEARGALRRCRRRLRRWSRHNSATFGHLDALLEAEWASLRGKDADAIRRYDEAIAAAAEAGATHVVALANECAAHHHGGLGRKGVATAYLTEAVRAYAHWGADGKLDRLADDVPELVAEARERITAARDEAADADRAGASLYDLDAVARASEVLTAQADLEGLVGHLLPVLLETTGAERGALVLAQDGGFSVRALAMAHERGPARLVSAPLAHSDEVCVPVVQYVARTHNQLMLHDAGADPRFEDLPYVTGRALRSVLCAPIAKSGEALGIVYLENNLVKGAFHDEHLRTLQIVCADAATAIESHVLKRLDRERQAVLGEALQKVELLEYAKGHLSKYVPEVVRRIIEENPEAPELEKREEDVSVLFLDLVGYTRLSEQLERRDVEYLVERYFSTYVDVIHENRGDVNETLGDGLMVIFRAPDARSHAENAARAAVGIQARTAELNAEIAERFEPLRVNVGINSGTALVGSSRFEGALGARYTFTASGSVTNLSARLMGSASGGETIVSAETARRIDGRFTLEPVGPLTLKNVADPVEAVRLVGVRHG